jgi:hypothetical protein
MLESVFASLVFYSFFLFTKYNVLWKSVYENATDFVGILKNVFSYIKRGHADSLSSSCSLRLSRSFLLLWRKSGSELFCVYCKIEVLFATTYTLFGAETGVRTCLSPKVATVMDLIQYQICRFGLPVSSRCKRTWTSFMRRCACGHL